MKSNEQVLADFIKERDPMALNPKWVVWALNLLTDANSRKVAINPEWLRADGRFLTANGVEDSEPPMEITMEAT